LLVLLRLVLEQKESLAAGLAARFTNEELVERWDPGRGGGPRQPEKDALPGLGSATDLRQPWPALGRFARHWSRDAKQPERHFDQDRMADEAPGGPRSGANVMDISLLDAA